MALIKRENYERAKEGLQSRNSQLVMDLVILLLNLILIAIVGQLLWNNAAVPLVPALAKCKNPLHILGTSALVSMMIM